MNFQSTRRKIINIHVAIGTSRRYEYPITDPQTGLEVIPYLEDIKNSGPALDM
jgi:hypothetical protein